MPRTVAIDASLTIILTWLDVCLSREWLKLWYGRKRAVLSILRLRRVVPPCEGADNDSLYQSKWLCNLRKVMNFLLRKLWARCLCWHDWHSAMWNLLSMGIVNVWWSWIASRGELQLQHRECDLKRQMESPRMVLLTTEFMRPHRPATMFMILLASGSPSAWNKQWSNVYRGNEGCEIPIPL